MGRVPVERHLVKHETTLLTIYQEATQNPTLWGSWNRGLWSFVVLFISFVSSGFVKSHVYGKPPAIPPQYYS